MAENEEKTKPINPMLEEVKAERAALEKAREEARQQADRLEALKSDFLLSGTAGLRPEIKVELSQEELNKKLAMDFWKGTAIADAIKKHG